MSAQTRSDISKLLEEHGLRPVHRLGQHFLADANVTRKIVRTAGVGAGDRVVEIGAGTGSLTSALASTGAHVVAYEIDERLSPILESVTMGLDVELRFADIADVDLADALEADGWTMVANLPYNVGTEALMEALRHAFQVERFVVMVQVEVAERLVASPGTGEYGIPSVITQIHADARLAFRVPSQVFFPAPKVESAVVAIERVPAPEFAERAIELARRAFGQRRKMLRRSLSSLLEDPVGALERASIDPTSRAEQLSPDDYLRLATVVP